MSVFHVAAGSAALIASLLLASVLIAAQTDPPQVSAQMNRHLYQPKTAVQSPYVPRHTARIAVPRKVPHAHMNRAHYNRVRRGE